MSEFGSENADGYEQTRPQASKLPLGLCPRGGTWAVTTAEANSVAANAELRAAEANRIAEGERLERSKLETRLAGRRLSAGQSLKLTASLLADRVKFVSINVTRLGDREAFDLASDIIEALMLSGVYVDVSELGSMSPPQYGLIVYDAPEGILRAAFDGAGIKDVRYIPSTTDFPSIFVG